jgi:hypothetical protein
LLLTKVVHKRRIEHIHGRSSGLWIEGAQSEQEIHATIKERKVGSCSGNELVRSSAKRELFLVPIVLLRIKGLLLNCSVAAG